MYTGMNITRITRTATTFTIGRFLGSRTLL